jgi:hypothetical protein
MRCLSFYLPDTSLETAVEDGLTSSSLAEYSFLHLAIFNDIKLDSVRSEVSVVGAWEIIFLSVPRKRDEVTGEWRRLHNEELTLRQV